MICAFNSGCLIIFQFYDGSLNNDDVLWTATGLRYPDVVVSTQAQITIVFASDLTLNATGFHIYWSAVPCKSKCLLCWFLNTTF